MKKTIQEKLDDLRKMAKRSVNQTPDVRTPAKPDSLMSAIRSKKDADMFMAQVEAVTRMAQAEYLASKEKESEDV